jgi:hypothetical protein
MDINLFFATLNVDSATGYVEFNLDPLKYPDELETEYLISLHRPDATLVVGYVIDEETREPINDVKVISLRDGNQVKTDGRGFFKIYINVPEDSILLKKPASLLFEKDGYQSVEYRYIETFPNSDLIYKVRMQKGKGKKVIDERKYRRRLNELQDEGNNGCLKCENKVEEKTSPNNKNGEGIGLNPLATSVVVPLYIRVGRDCSGTSCSRVEYYSLETYCKYVLPAEWYSCWGSLAGGMNSLKAGAVAVRTYGLWRVYKPLSSNYDICDNTDCQVFGNSQSANTNKAVDETQRYILVDGNGNIVKSEYSAENNNKGCGDGYSGTGTTWPCIYDPVCLGQTPNGHGRGLCQWGSVRWATGTKVLTSSPCALGVSHGYGVKDWQQILSHYYPSYQISQAVEITIASATASPNNVKPGDVFTIYYSVNSTGSSDVILGASIAPSGTTDWISDPTSDKKVNIQAGTNNVSRIFKVPSNASPGSYDLFVALWYDNNNNGQIGGGYPYDFPINTKIYQNAIIIVSPTLSVNPTSLSFGNVPVGTSSIPQSYTITGSNLTSNVVINAPSGFEVSTSSGGPYGSSLTLSPSGGSISATVYVRFSPTSAQSYSGNITNTSSGITRNVSVSGTGVQPTPSPPVLVSPGTSSPPGQIFYNMPPSLFIWRSVPNVDMYGFYQEKRDTSGKWVLISQKNTPDTSLSFVYVQVVGAYDGEYRWYVNAHNSAGWGSFSAPLYYKVVTPASISVDLAYIDFGDVQVGSFLDKNITIRNSGSGTLSVRLSISGNSFSIISGGDTFNLSSGQTRVVGIRFSPASGGSYTGTLNITHNATNQPSPITIPLSGNGVELVTHEIPLLKGWNMISSFVLPIDIKLDSIFKNIKSNFVILKDGLGRSYWPFLGVDQIGNWSIYSGYQVYMENPDTLKIVGHIIKPETTIYSLQKGWNLISYVRRTPMDIDSALSSIKSYINIVKDNDGRVYWPKYTVNQIGLMKPGQGYLINVTQECRFSYPANERVSTSINLNIIGSTDSSYKTSSEPVHFKFVRNTGNNATVGIPLSAQPSVNGVPLEVGDEIGAFTPAGLCVGAVVWEQKNTALTVWGDDEMTPEVDGIKPGEQISYRIWKRSTDREYQATATYSLGDGIYQPNAIFILSSLSARLTPVEISDVNLPNIFVLYQNYPNPFNPTTTIKYGIPVRAHVKLEIYNILGQKVETLIDALQEPGFYFFDIDASRFSGGVYFYRLTAVSEKSVFSDYKKMIILK